jgi:hypothetical protein
MTQSLTDVEGGAFLHAMRLAILPQRLKKTPISQRRR